MIKKWQIFIHQHGKSRTVTFPLFSLHLCVDIYYLYILNPVF